MESKLYGLVAPALVALVGMSAAFPLETPFSQTWYRVAGLRPRLRTQVAFHRHRYRRRSWYVLLDPYSGRSYRFTPEAYWVAGQFDGRQSVQAIWEKAQAVLGAAAPEQDSVIQLMSALHDANALQMDVPADWTRRDERRKKRLLQKRLQPWKSPLSIRLPLWDPERFLVRTAWLVRPLYSLWGAALIALILLLGAVLAAIHWVPLTENLSDRILSADGLLMLVLVYPFVKAAHELAHAYTVRINGGEVHEIGIMLLVFFPVPYVDASASSVFPERGRRMLVSAAGVLAELVLAALAMLVWVAVEPGWVRTLAFNVMMIGGISSLLFNGNPLLRFDAYYTFSDWLEIPNLGQKANRYLGYLGKRYVLGLHALWPQQDRRESAWLASYAVASWCYRVVIMVAIALFVASEYWLFGVLLAIWLVFSSLIWPTMKLIKTAYRDVQIRQRPARVLWRGGVLLLLLIVLVGLVPFPLATDVEGVIWPEESALIKADTHGEVELIALPSGTAVRAGNMLLQLRADDVQEQVSVLTARQQELAYRLQAALQDPVQMALVEEERQLVAEQLALAAYHLRQQQILSPGQGRLQWIDGQLLAGRWVERGDLLGYLLDAEQMDIVFHVAEDDIKRVRNDTQAVHWVLASGSGRVHHSGEIQLEPAIGGGLISPVLSVGGGGKIALDPRAPEQELRPFQNYFLGRLAVPEALPERVEERVYIRFEHSPEPLLQRWYRNVRRVFLRQLNV